MRSLRGNLGGIVASSATAFIKLFQSFANSSARSRSRTTFDGTVRMMLSNSNSAQGDGAARSCDHLQAVVTPEMEERALVSELVMSSNRNVHSV